MNTIHNDASQMKHIAAHTKTTGAHSDTTAPRLSLAALKMTYPSN